MRKGGKYGKMKKRILSVIATAMTMAMVFGMTAFAAPACSPSPCPTPTPVATPAATSTPVVTTAPAATPAPAAAPAAAVETPAPAKAAAPSVSVAMASGVAAVSGTGAKVNLTPVAPVVIASAQQAAAAVVPGGTVTKVMDIKIENATGGQVTVAGVGLPGMNITVLHFNGASWDNYGTYPVAANGTLTFNAPSLSPIAFVAGGTATTSPKTGDQ